MKKGSKQKRHCGQIAMTKARRARRKHSNPIVIGLLFIAALVPIGSFFSFKGHKRNHDFSADWPISDYERGYSTQPNPIKSRYEKQPTMKRLMRDLRRPAARDEAMHFLIGRIDDIALRSWVIEQIREDHINRLAIHVQPCLADTAIIAKWQAELHAEMTAPDETGADLLTPV